MYSQYKFISNLHSYDDIPYDIEPSNSLLNKEEPYRIHTLD